MEIKQTPLANTKFASTNLTAAKPAYQTDFASRMQHSKVLTSVVAVLGVTLTVVAAALAPVTLAHSTSLPATKHGVIQSKSVQSSQATSCANCATVEAVTAVQRQGQVNGVAVGNQTIGLGTVAGGLIGGLLGNQVGGGNGKTLATVAGVAGGAFAGNTIEKNMKRVTVYNVRLRMNDGSRRNMEISSTVPVGSKVVIEGKNLRMASTAG